MNQLRYTSLLILMLMALCAAHAESEFAELDKALSMRDHYFKRKETRIDSLKRRLDEAPTPEMQIAQHNAIFNEFLTFNFDSTMYYLDKAERVADAIGTYDASSQVKIHRALALATSGHFSHAVSILDGIDSRRLSVGLQEEYYMACEWSYGVWAAYSDKRSIAPEFTAKSILYLDSLISVTAHGTPEYTYRVAEKNLRSKQYHEAEKNYLATLRNVPVTSRLYAQAAYALAMTYDELGDAEKYKEWLIKASISDQVIPLKENLALQQLAMYLRTQEGDLTRANTYLKVALEDAVFFNNRLRMLEIAEKIPDISNIYETTIERNNTLLKVSLIFIGVLVVLLGIALVSVYLQQKKVKENEVALNGLNSELLQLNRQLKQTNASREQYVSLFMDLCAAYIEKLNRFPTVLKMKVKSVSDLNSVADRYIRPSEGETKEMFFNFDSAFLRLYPDFVVQFNSLLKEDERIYPKKGELLNTDLRIYALVRMGITESSKIATLLFLSPQTIFNHRTKIRNKASSREDFEKEVLSICPTMPD